MPGICAASSLIRAIASPELTPGAPDPENSNEEMPLKRDSVVRGGRPAGRREGRERHHLAVRSAHEPLLRSSGARAIGGVALHIDALHATAVDEVVDILATPSGASACIRRRSASGLAPPASAGPCRYAASRCRAVRSGAPSQRSDRHWPCASNLSRAAPNCSCVEAAGVLQLHREAVRRAEAADRRRHQREDLRVAKPAERADARCVIASAVFSLPLRSFQSRS